MRSELGENVFYIAAQGAGCDAHLAGHLRGALPRDDSAHHLHFARRERSQGILARLRVRPPSRLARKIWIKNCPARADHVQSGQDLFGLLVLTEESRNTDLLRLPQHRWVCEAGKHEDFCVRMVVSHSAGCIQTAAVGKTQVQ